MALKDWIDATRQGCSLANAATWKNRAFAITTMAGLLTAMVAIAGGFGYVIPFDSETIDAFARVVVSVVLLFNGAVHITTSDKVGLPSVPDDPVPVVPPVGGAADGARSDGGVIGRDADNRCGEGAAAGAGPAGNAVIRPPGEYVAIGNREADWWKRGDTSRTVDNAY